MKKKNGFTLVELLAVIVVLALIMIIAIPSVLDVMNNARRHSFALYIEKVIKDTQTQYVMDAQSTIQGSGVYVYNIETDLNYTSTGNYHGYVLVNAIDVDEPHYIIYLYDSNYMIFNYDVTQSHKFPSADDKNLIIPFNENDKNTNFGNEYIACRTSFSSDTSIQCQNPKGFIIGQSS